MYEELPYVFVLANMRDQKTVLTYEEYVKYLGVWRELSDETKEKLIKIKKNMGKD